MSTENEGAAVPPVAGPPSAPGATGASAPASGAPTAGGSAGRAERQLTSPAPRVPSGAQPALAGGAPSAARAAADSDYTLPAPAPSGARDTERTAQLPAVAGADARTGGRVAAASAEQPRAGSDHPVPPPPHHAPGAGSPGGPSAGSPSGGAAWPPPTPPGGTWGGGPVPPPPPGAPRGRSGGLVAALLAAALIAGGIGGGVGYWAAEQRDSAGSTTISSAGGTEVLNRSPKSVAGIAQRALPSVVTIEAQGATGEGGTGTGFVYDKQGHILTNNHVVAPAADGGRLTATFSDGRKYAAEVIGRAQGYDVAVIKLRNASGAKLNPLQLGDSDKGVAVGDSTIAIGAPFGLSGTVTTGIVSAKNRPVASSDGGSSNASYMSAIQTDASINPGNSGGPLLNAQGAVIGINSAIQSAGGGGGFGGESTQAGSIGLGFAIPINQAKRVAETLIRTGQPVYPVIGVQVDMRDQGNGARISQTGSGGDDSVTPGGPADRAGLRPGDVITKLDDTLIDSGPTLISEIWTHKPGDKVQLTYKRGGKQSTVEVTLGQRKGDS